MQTKLIFISKTFALSLAFIMRSTVTRKWPIMKACQRPFQCSRKGEQSCGRAKEPKPEGILIDYQENGLIARIDWLVNPVTKYEVTSKSR